ncbi:protein translocase subunit SecF [Pseudonocardia acaciae]|uniref:protein translocase subunit SecF n=1 Tax=Pseudonocardia acaciae TaxID=551276 RepID=UPI00048A9824|nr:protein translocase subunit SecF [Pseudonocardia acaciae]
MATYTSTSAAGAPGKGGVFNRLYTGTGAFDIVGRRKRWYWTFAVLVVICIASMVFRGFNLGIEFVGGTQIQFPVAGVSGEPSSDRINQVINGAIGQPPKSVQHAGSGASETVVIRTEALTGAEQFKVRDALFNEFHPRGQDGRSTPNVISESAVSSSWGNEITSQALIALAVFMVLVSLFLALYFERSMAIAAVVALVHDLVVTAGVYSLVGFEVSPGTVIGLLTILGFSLYDTVVVFDKVKENSRGLLGLTRRTYAETANLALNQTLMRSINTSLIAVLPVGGLLVVGVGVLGVGTLADLALVQMVGMIAGALSSIFLATPILVDLKMRDRRYQQQAARVMTRRKRLAQARDAGGDEDELDVTDDEALGTELRRERAITAAAGVPARAPSARRNHTSRAERTGRAARPTGKRRR